MTFPYRATRILLFSPELRERTYAGRPPIYYLSSILRRAGYSVLTIDVDILGRRKFVEVLRRFQPAIIAGTSLSVQINDALQLFKLAKATCPSAINVLGGSHATAAGEFLYPFHADYLDGVIVGEGLTSIRMIAQIVEDRRWASRKCDIPGLLYWDGNKISRAVCNVSEAPDEYLPDLEYHHDSYNFDIFCRADGSRPKTFQMMTAFGCENACFFCFSSTNKRGEEHRVERRMSIDLVERTLRKARDLGYEAVYFDDDTFTRVRAHALEVARICKRYNLIFGCHTRPDCEDDDLISTLSECGCRYMFSGLESIVPEILLGANKTRDPIIYRERYLRSYQRKKEVGLPASAFLIHGMPRRSAVGPEAGWGPDTLEDSCESISFAVRALDPAYLSMNVLRFIPGVPFSEHRRFEFLRPVKGPLHGGYFDEIWVRAHGLEDPRCFHPILRAFEGAGSPIPKHMSPWRCYGVLQKAVDSVNTKNAEPGRNQTRIVVDRWFKRRFLKERWCSHVLKYELASFEAIQADQNSQGRAATNSQLLLSA
jgi:anaerobic magnesium-protoporphyrin IX monomethyl ester cyclase